MCRSHASMASRSLSGFGPDTTQVLIKLMPKRRLPFIDRTHTDRVVVVVAVANASAAATGAAAADRGAPAPAAIGACSQQQP